MDHFRSPALLPILLVSAVLFLFPALAAASTFQAADVLGQTSGGSPTFTTNNTDNGTTTNAAGYHYPDGIALDPVNHWLFVEDDENSRVLEYNLDSNNHLTHYTADHVLGQQNFAANQVNQGGAASSTTMNFPFGIAYNSAQSRLFVGDTGNSRVLIFNLSGGISNDMPARLCLGPAKFQRKSGKPRRRGELDDDVCFLGSYLRPDQQSAIRH